MERIEARLRRNGETLDTAQSTRLNPPLLDGVYQDLGTSFKQASSQTSKGKLIKTESGYSHPDLHSGSDDEMDCLSQKSQADDELVVSERPTYKNRSEYDPEVIAAKSLAIQNIRFKKMPKAKVEEGKPGKPSFSPSTPPKVMQSPKGPHRRHDRENNSNEYDGRKSVAKPKTVPPNSETPQPKPRPRPRPRPVAPLPTSIEVDNVSIPLKPISVTNKITRTPSEFPLPSPISKVTAGNLGQTSLSPSTILSSSSSGNATTASSSSHNPPLSSTYSSAIVSSESTSRVQQSFPTLSPLNSPKDKRSKVVPARSVPVISSLSRKDGGVRQFLTHSPLSANQFKAVPKSGKKDKGKRKADALTPFPMSTQDFGGISPPGSESTAGKRHARKRRLQIVDEASAMVNDMDFYEEDSLFMSPSVDPNTLCPYCDSPLPLSPTPFFQYLLKSTLSKSYSDPRSTNPLGRKAPLSTFVAVCQRHDFETKVLPEAEAKGWPKSINWEELGDRVSRMKLDLEGIIQDSGEADLRVWIKDEQGGGGDLMTTFAFKGPRVQCVFWREAMKSFLESGARAMANVRGQFQNFEKSQPGYYGELGQIIIQQTLFNMFPPDAFDLKLVKPFTANDFIQRILVPEVALRLIMEDRGLKGLVGAEIALPILRESTTYGVTMFPEDSGEGMGAGVGGRKSGKVGLIGVGDKIVMERAMKRRREIESGEVEGLFGDPKEGGVTGEGKKKARGMKNATGEASNTPWSQDPELEEHGWKTRSRLSEKARKMPSTDGDDDDNDDAITIDSKTDGNDSEKSIRTDGPKARSRPRRNTKRINYDEDSDIKSVRIQRSGRSLSKLGNRSSSRTQSRPPAASESRRLRSSSASAHRSLGEDVGPKAQHLEISDIDLCSTDVDPESNQETYKPKFQRSLHKRRTHTPSAVIDLDVNTPRQKRRSVVREYSKEDEEPTPRPTARKPSVKSASPSKQRTVLSLARARASKARGTGVGAGDSKKSGLEDPIQGKWYPNIRASMSHMSNGSSESEPSADVEGVESARENKRTALSMGKGDGESTNESEQSYSWLLDDPPSQKSLRLQEQEVRPG